MVEFGKERAMLHQQGKQIEPLKVDNSKLYEYCGNIFSKTGIEKLLTQAYFLRLNIFGNKFIGSGFLVSNERILDFLQSLPVEYQMEKDLETDSDLEDVIAWEIYRQILSPYIDKEEKDIYLVKSLIEKRQKELLRFKDKCLLLAKEFRDNSKNKSFSEKISQHVRLRALKEIQELLMLDKEGLTDFVNLVFSDEKNWLALAGFIIGLFAGGPIITAGATIVALSNLTAKAFKVNADINKKIKSSDYAIIYRINN